MKEKKREKRIKSTKGSKISFRSRPWASITSYLMVSSRTLPSHYLEINPQTLTQASSISWMDHEDCLVFIISRVRIKCATTQSSQDFCRFPFIWILGYFCKQMVESLSLAWKQGCQVFDLWSWWQGTHQNPKLSCHAQSQGLISIYHNFSLTPNH